MIWIFGGVTLTLYAWGGLHHAAVVAKYEEIPIKARRLLAGLVAFFWLPIMGLALIEEKVMRWRR